SLLIFIQTPRHHPTLHSFPTRRSSDLFEIRKGQSVNLNENQSAPRRLVCRRLKTQQPHAPLIQIKKTPGLAAESLPDIFQFSLQDRKSTRLNSSHLVISYAVFCLKKKN